MYLIPRNVNSSNADAPVAIKVYPNVFGPHNESCDRGSSKVRGHMRRARFLKTLITQEQ